MIGFYDYTVLLTYISILSAGTGIVVSLSGSGHPYIGMFFLLLCGLCDAFDGKVARTKKDRRPMEQSFGIQIDSLSDVVAFGVLPACIGAAMLRHSSFFLDIHEKYQKVWYVELGKYILFAVLILYILAAMIRLAYFNVTEEERQKTEGGTRKYYTGLPVTSAALIFPTVLLFQYITKADVTPVYFVTTIFTGLAFLLKFQIRKPGIRGVLILVGIGMIEAALIVVLILIKKGIL